MLNVDKTPPAFELPILSPPPNKNGWNKESVSASIEAADVMSGINSSLSRFEVDGIRTPGLSGTIVTEGKHTVRVLAADFAGNFDFSPGSLVQIDMTSPQVTITSPSDNQSIALTTVDVQILASDNLSGIDKIECSVNIDNEDKAVIVAFPLDATNYICKEVPIPAHDNKITAVATDLAGNVKSSTTINVINPNPLLP